MYFVKTEGDSKLHDVTGLDDGRRATYILPKNVTFCFSWNRLHLQTSTWTLSLIVLSASMYLGAAWWRKLRMTLWHNLSHYLTVSLATTDPSTTTSSKDTAGHKCDTRWTGHVSLSMGTLLIHLGLLLPDGNAYINISGIWTGRGDYNCAHNNHSCLTIATPGPWALIDNLLWGKCR